jgi:polysaccharide biosynthesis/export protein
MRHNRRLLPPRAGLFLACALFLGAARLEAQQPVQPPAGVTETQVLERLRQSGMTRQQARTRLAQLGYDPALADAYFDRLEGRGGAQLSLDSDFLRALSEMGILSRVGPMGDTIPGLGFDSISGLDTIPPLDSIPADSLRVFGRDIFRRGGTQFDPVLAGPVDAGYRVGPGDQLLLVLTGDVEAAYNLQVAREGYVVIPDVGQIFVSGLTMDDLRNRLYERLGRVYSGVQRGAGATTFFDVSLGRLRTNQVFVIGDVERPGSYQVSAASTVFNALYRAGGPSELGSFRNVLVRRGGAVVAQVDLYDYLLRGDATRDVRLDQGDIVFVPPAGIQVKVQGKVRRPAIYEVLPSEGVRDVIAFAGGVDADAHVQRIQIDRVLSPVDRIPGVDRVLLDVDLVGLGDPSAEPVPLKDGDEVRVFATLAERRNRVAIAGSVFRPGLYEYRPGMTIWDLIEKADGLAEEAFRPVAHVIRPIPETGAARLLRVSLAADASGQRVQDLALQDRDSVVVFGVDSLLVQEFVAVEGYVKRPGRYPLTPGMTVEDLVLQAHGFSEGANTAVAEVARINPTTQRGDTIAVPVRISLAGEVPNPTAATPGSAAVPGLPSGSQLVLRHEDRVFVRRAPGFVEPQTVTASGEVLFPGPYAIQSRDERLSSLLARAGGVTDQAYVAGARLLRDSVLVGIDLVAALRNPGREEDVILEPGDELQVPIYDGTVLVQGAVAFESRVIYRRGRDLKDYISEAGGALPEADVGRISVQYPSGERATVSRTLWVRNYPEVEPGSTIFVPARVGGPGVNWTSIITTSVSVVSALATLIIAVNSLP